MPDLTIALLQLHIEGATGHEHRVQPIARRAATVLGEHLSAWYGAASQLRPSVRLEAITAPALSVDLNHTSDEQAARQIAGAWLEALALHLKA
jgi:hypothetical protein